MSNSSIWPIDTTLPGATTPGLSRPGSNGNEEVLCIPQSSSITGTSPSDCLMSYQDTCWRGSTPLQWCSLCILQPQPNTVTNAFRVNQFLVNCSDKISLWCAIFDVWCLHIMKIFERNSFLPLSSYLWDLNLKHFSEIIKELIDIHEYVFE